jgi:lysozyme
MRRRTAFLILTAVALSAAAGALWLFQNGYLRFNYPPISRFPVQGIDVSHHQGEIDWQEIAKPAAVRFVFIKATEGGDYVDPRFAKNWDGAKRAGLVRGAYHFFTFCRSGAEQAANYLAAVPGDGGALPVTIDLEFGGNCARKPTPDELIAELRAFVGAVQAVDPRKPIFYVTPEFFSEYIEGRAGAFPAHHLWLRNVFFEPSSEPCKGWSIWQFANNGLVGGISDPVDLNAFCGDREEFTRLFGVTLPN